MRLIRILLILIFGITAVTVFAQKADSVIVICDHQKSIIPLPVFGGQTSVSYADSNKVVEIGVWVRIPAEPSKFPQVLSKSTTAGIVNSKSKWFSEVEAAYIKGLTQVDVLSYSFSNNNGDPYITWSRSISLNDLKGFQIRLALFEKEYKFENKYSFNSTFKFGFSKSFLEAGELLNESDSIGNIINTYQYNHEFNINSYQFLYQLGISYHFTLMELPARINVGNCLGFSATKIYGPPDLILGYSKYPVTLLQPYFGLEIWKMGAMFSADLNFPPNHSTALFKYVGRSIGFSFTYRIF